MPKRGMQGLFRHPIKVKEEKIDIHDVIITIYRHVPDYVVGRSASHC